MTRGTKYTRWLVLATTAVAMSGCTLKPKETAKLDQQLQEAGKPYQKPFEQRQLPELPSPSPWQDVLQRAFLANGDLEGAYHEWRAAEERIGISSSWPNTNVQVGFDYMFSKEKMKAWDRTTLSAGFDPAMSLTLPVKAKQAGKVALEEARVASYRFEAAKFDLQKRVLTAYLDLALTEEQVRIQRENVELFKMIAGTAAQRVRAGAPQQDLLKAQTEYELARNELATMESQLNSMRAMLNGMLARDAQAPLVVPQQLPAPRPLGADDARLIAVAVDRNPELAGLARQVAGRREALELARLQYIPDVNPTAAITGNVSQALGAMVVLPTNLPAIRGAIQEAQAMLRSTEAMARQTRSDRAAAFVAALYAMRNNERQVAVFRDTILPKANQVLAASRQAYAAGSVPFAELVDSQRTLLDVRLLIAQARIDREKRLAEMEALAGIDIETLAAPATQPSTQPATRPTTAHTSPEAGSVVLNSRGSSSN